MKIRIYGDPALKKASEPVGSIDEEIVDFANFLLEMMMKYDGVGLAANQLGRHLRMIALNVPSAARKNANFTSLSPGEMALLPLMPLVIINPEIISMSQFENVKDEGCLSVPGIYAPVSRPVSLMVKAEILGKGQMLYDCGGLLGRALQHELDHLNGILFIDRLSDNARKAIKAELKKIRVKNKDMDGARNDEK